MKRTIIALCALAAFTPASISAHCQVPCGIYADDNVIGKMHTDYETIEKASKQIIELSKDPAKNAHQLTRWILNKESHAQSIQTTVTDYFLAQRIKLGEASTDKESYLKKVTSCHRLIVAAMKCKQDSNPATAEALKKSIYDLYRAYEGKEPQFEGDK